MGSANLQLNRIILSLGSNIGDRLQNLERAKAELKVNGFSLLLESSVYETEAWGNTEQNAFYNIAVEAETNLSPQIVMQTIIAIEKKMGRVRNRKWAPRIIDIDILFYNTEIIHEPNLTIPHPHLHERKFVLEPLDEIIPFYLHPVFKKEIHSLYNQLNDSLKVSRLFTTGNQ